MTKFMEFNKALQAQLSLMQVTGELFRVDVEKNDVWDMYLASFPEGTNPIYKERTEHDCNCCKQFIRDLGSVVAIKGNSLMTIWDVEGLDSEYQVVADALADYVKRQPIKNVYRHYQKKVGTPHNHQTTEEGTIIKWDHFNAILPKQFVTEDRSIGDVTGEFRTNYEVLQRSLEEISMGAIDIVLELIAQNSIYRGKEFEPIVKKLKKVKKAYDKLKEGQHEIFLWKTSVELGGAGRFKNTVIGTLLADISSGVDLEDAVKLYESKVAPHNYKRSSALITKGMIDKAQKTVEKLGIEDSLQRRYAQESDITVNNVLFADRSTKKVMKGALDDLQPTKKAAAPDLKKVQEIDIEDFINDVLPKADSISAYVANKHTSNLVSLVAPVHEDAPGIFKWDNNFSWSYNGEVTDSIKERVKSAGGNVTGDVRVSLSWFNYDDLDIHVIEPRGGHIYFGNNQGRSGGILDVDMNAGSGRSREAVENITWARKGGMVEGNYKVYIHNYSKRENVDVGFEVEMEVNGDITSFSYKQPVTSGVKISVVDFSYSKKEGVKIVKSHLPNNTSSKEAWGINTEDFQKVKMVMNSPNHWDGEKTGNKHYFFMLEGCYNPEPARGFYNEFLKQELNPHRKVFEVLASKMKTEETEQQLSGLGFSSTKNDELLVKVEGSFNRMLKIKF